jgi:hypothetical protein
MPKEGQMQRGSSKAAPRVDEALKHDTEGMIRGGHATHSEEWKGTEPSGEDQPTVGLRPDEPDLEGPSNREATAADIEARSELASYLGRAHYPLRRAEVLALLDERNAPDHVVAMASRLEADATVANLQDLWRRIGGATE